MKKLLTSLLAVAMVLTMGATSVFAESGNEPFMNPDGTNSKDIDLTISLTSTGVDGTGEDFDANNVEASKRVMVMWTTVEGEGTYGDKYVWNTNTLQYEVSNDTVTISKHPQLGVTIKNYSNTDVAYEIELTSGSENFDNIPKWANGDEDLSKGRLNSAALGVGWEQTGTATEVKFGKHTDDQADYDLQESTFSLKSSVIDKSQTTQTVGTVTVTISNITVQ